MKNTFVKTTVGTFLGLLMLLIGTQTLVFGQENKINGQQSSALVGAWLTTVTQRNCQTGDPLGPSFQGLLTFNEGGTMTEYGSSPNPPFRSPGHGIWEASNQFHPTFAFNFMRFNPDGTFAGRNTIRGTTTFGASGNDFTTTAAIEVTNATGGIIAMGCATSTATRFQ